MVGVINFAPILKYTMLFLLLRLMKIKNSEPASIMAREEISIATLSKKEVWKSTHMAEI